MRIVLQSIEQEKETLVLKGVSHPTPNEVGASFPDSEPGVYLLVRSGWAYSINLRHSLRDLFMAAEWTDIHLCMPFVVQDSPSHALQCRSPKLRTQYQGAGPPGYEESRDLGPN